VENVPRPFGNQRLRSRRLISRSTASRIRSARFSFDSSTSSIRASVPSGSRAGICSCHDQAKGLPMNQTTNKRNEFGEKASADQFRAGGALVLWVDGRNQEITLRGRL
jgi:hypothetical protein